MNFEELPEEEKVLLVSMVSYARDHPTQGRPAGRVKLCNAFEEHGATDHLARQAAAAAKDDELFAELVDAAPAEFKGVIPDEEDEEEPSKAPTPTQIELIRKLDKMKREFQKYEELEALLVATFEDVLPEIPGYETGERDFPEVSGDKQPATLMAEASDWHVGKKVDSQHVAGLGGYGFDIFRSRLRHYRDTIFTVYEEWSQVRPIEQLVINFLGDILDGHEIYKGQSWFQDRHLVEQFCGALVEAGQWIRDLGTRIPKIKICSVPGNHSRLSDSRTAVPPDLNAETLWLRMLQLQLRDLEGVEMSVAMCPWMGYELYGKNHFLTHGSETRMWNQIPFYGLSRDTMRRVAMTQKIWHYTHCGHFHQDADLPVSSLRILMNGSMVGPDLYSTTEMKSAVPASQTLYLVHREHGPAWKCDVRLEEIEPLTVDEEGFYTPVDSGRMAEALGAFSEKSAE